MSIAVSPGATYGLAQPHYLRPGLCVVSAAFDHVDVDEVVGLIAALEPHVEQILVAFVDVPVPEALAQARARFTPLPLRLAHFGPGGQPTAAYQQLCRLSPHRFTLYLPPHARVSAAQLEGLRACLPELGEGSAALRLPGEPREWTTHYAQRVWRTSARLFTDGAGNLRGWFDGHEPDHAVRVFESWPVAEPGPKAAASGAAPSPEEPEPLANTVPERGTSPRRTPTRVSIATGPTREACAPIAEVLGATADGDDALARWAHGAMRALAGEPEATPLMPADVRPDLARLSDADWQRGAEALLALCDSPTPVSVAPDLCPLLPGLLAQLQDASLALDVWIALPRPSDLAIALQKTAQLPSADGLRFYRDYLTRLSECLAHGLAAHVHVLVPAARGGSDAALCRPHAAAVDGSEVPRVSALLGEEARPGEAQAIVLAYTQLCTMTAGRATDRTTGNALQVLALHRADGAAAARFIDAHANDTRLHGEAPALTLLLAAGAEAPPALPPSVSLVDLAQGDPGPLLEQCLRGATADITLFTTTDMVPVAGVCAAHLDAHRSATRDGWALGRVSGALLRDDDGPLLCAQTMRDSDLLPHAFPEHASVPTRLLCAQRPFRAGEPLAHGFARSAMACAGAFRSAQRLVATLSRAIPVDAEALSAEQAAAARAIGPLFERGPTPLSRARFLRALWEGLSLWDRREQLQDKAAQLEALLAHGPLPERVEQARAQLLRMLQRAAALEGALSSSPAMIRVLSRHLAFEAVATLGERWQVPGRTPESAQASDPSAHRARLRALEGAHAGETLYLLGTSPQLRELREREVQVLERRVCIGINDAHFMVRPRYSLSAYVSRVALARARLGERTTVLHMRAEERAPLVAGSLPVRRADFEGALPTTFGDVPTLYTLRNALLAGLHLALVLGAKRIVVLGVEQANNTHFYSADPALRASLREAFEPLWEQPFLGIDHAYERAVHIDRHIYGKPASAWVQHPNAFAAHDHARSFAAYLRALGAHGVECVSTVPDNVLTQAGAAHAPLSEVL